MKSLFILKLFLIPLQISGVSSDNLSDCYFTDSRRESLVFVCENSREPYNETDCIDRLFNDDNKLIHRAKIKHLHMGECHSDSLNRYLFKTFINLRSFYIPYFGTQQLTAEALDLPTLEIFNASHNKIADLPESVLVNLKNLIEADFSFNQLTKLHPSCFEGIEKVTTLIFSHNKIRILGVNTFQKLKKLIILDLSHNLIDFIEENQFKFNENLANLRLDANPIKRFDCNVFWPLMNTVSVAVSWDSLEELDTSCLKQSLKIKVQSDEIITSLSISMNKIENILEVIDSLGPSIKYLDLSSNFIGKLSAHTFERIDQLKHLNLSQTNLSNFGFSTFYHQRNLDNLDLSFNRLKKIHFTLLLRNFKNLETLNLEGNDLTEINTLTKEYFPKLKTLGLSRNNFTCDYLANFLLRWSQLHLMDNPSQQKNIDGVDCVHADQVRRTENEADWSNETEEIPKEGMNINVQKYGNPNQKLIIDSHNDIHSGQITPTHVLEELRTVKYLLFALCIMCFGYLVIKSKVVQKLRCKKASCSQHQNVEFQRNVNLNDNK